MLPKKFLSLSLAVSLAVGSTLNVFADNSQFGADTIVPSVSDVNLDLMNNASELFKRRACVVMLLKALCVTTMSLAVQDFCTQLELLKKLTDYAAYLRKAEEITDMFRYLYKNDLSFRQIADSAWSYSVTTGKKSHASIHCHRGIGHLSRKNFRRCPGRSIDG